MSLRPMNEKKENPLVIRMTIDLEEELDRIESFKRKRHLDYETLAALYDLLLNKKIICTSDIPDALREEYGIISKAENNYGGSISMRTLSKYISILTQVDDFHRTFQFDVKGYGNWYVAYATKVEAELCKKRHISLYTFLTELRELLDEFHIRCVVYYEHRQARTKPPQTMTDMKNEFEQRIFDKMGENIKARKYIRTEQDLVQLKMGDARKGFMKEVYGK